MTICFNQRDLALIQYCVWCQLKDASVSIPFPDAFKKDLVKILNKLYYE